MNTRCLLTSLALSLAAAAAAQDSQFPRPSVAATPCSPHQRTTAVRLTETEQPPIACFALEKWSFKGAGLAVVHEPQVTSEAFRELQKSIYRDQSVRLRALRDLSDSVPDKPPSHAAIPRSLYVDSRTPLGVFTSENDYIGFADLIPVARSFSGGSQMKVLPLIQLDTFVRRGGEVVRLRLLAPLVGTTTVAEGYRIAEDWALAILGRARPASQQ